MKGLIAVLALLSAFAAGVAAQRASMSSTFRGTVLDAGTVAEEIAYWEIRSSSGESIVVTGRADLAIMQWLRQAKGRSVTLTVAADASSGSAQ